MNTLSVSSYSLREQLGPIDLSAVAPDGREIRFATEYPRLIALTEFPRLAADRFAVTAVETVAFQFAGVDDPELDRFAAEAVAAGATLLNVAVDDGDLLADDPARRADDIAALTAWIDRCAELGSVFVRVNPGSPLSPNHGSTPPDHLVEALARLGSYARERGVRLLVENHGGRSSDAVWMNRLLDAVGPENLGLLLDLGNFDVIMAPMMAPLTGGPAGPLPGPAELEPVYEGIDALAGRAELVHVKAHEVADDGAIGLVDLPRALGILARHGYRGPLTIEYEGTGGDPWSKIRQILDLTAAMAPATD
ncbi:TIM barrel protein [Pseudonocardia nematodicida]|uniref:TIM barrel protein n=1 Tax=Pseudonocardia nematodicida TaxID=1206997 RepID=A0ABV1KIJ9_9PSEU